MGRVPDTFAGRKITYRTPHTLATLVTIASGTKGVTATLTHNSDKPFEIHRFTPRVFTAGSAPATRALYTIGMDLLDISRNQPLTMGSPLIATLLKGTVEATWEWGEPYYLERTEGFQATLNSYAAPGTVVSLELALQGELLILGAASDRRG